MANAASVPAKPTQLAVLYPEALTLAERLHRRALDAIKDHLDRNGCPQVNAVQALLIYNIGEAELPIGDILRRGYYLGSNVSYNVKKLAALGFISRRHDDSDERRYWIRLSARGLEIRKMVIALYEKQFRQVAEVTGVTDGDLALMNRTIHRLERFLADQVAYRL